MSTGEVTDVSKLLIAFILRAKQFTLLGLPDPEDEGTIIFPNVGNSLTVGTAYILRRLESLALLKLDISDEVRFYTRKKNFACTGTVFSEPPTEASAQCTIADTERQVKTCFTARMNKMSTSQQTMSSPNDEVLSLTEENTVDMQSFGGRLLVAKDGQHCPAQTTAKVNCKLNSQKIYLFLKKGRKVH